MARDSSSDRLCMQTNELATASFKSAGRRLLCGACVSGAALGRRRTVGKACSEICTPCRSRLRRRTHCHAGQRNQSRHSRSSSVSISFADFSRVSLHAYSGVLRNCADRLDDSLSVRAELASSDLSRADAVRKAKAEKEAHVVWLQLRANNFSGETGVYDDPYDVYIQYAVFAPTTGKQVTSGNTYPGAYRNKRIKFPVHHR